MMQRFVTVTGPAIPLGLRNVDTDLIIAARYLKWITRKGLGEGAFAALRAEPGNLFDQPRYKGAPILIAGDNFGCGSSREHAPWALADLGIRVIVAPRFADIFAGNAFKNGILLVQLPQEQVDRLLAVAADHDITVDLEHCVVTTPFQERFAFAIDPFRRHCLLSGLDEIGLTQQMAHEIASYERELADRRPWVTPNRAASLAL